MYPSDKLSNKCLGCGSGPEHANEHEETMNKRASWTIRNAKQGAEPVPVPDEIRAPCPMAKKLVRAATCAACEHFRGAHLALANPSLRFADQYMVACAFPRLIEIKEVEA